MKIATLDAPARAAVTSTVGALSDPALLRATSTLVRHERHLQGAVIDHLGEIEARRLYLRRGCSSLFDYAVRELGYSDAPAGPPPDENRPAPRRSRALRAARSRRR